MYSLPSDQPLSSTDVNAVSRDVIVEVNSWRH